MTEDLNFLKELGLNLEQPQENSQTLNSELNNEKQDKKNSNRDDNNNVAESVDNSTRAEQSKENRLGDTPVKEEVPNSPESKDVNTNQKLDIDKYNQIIREKFGYNTIEDLVNSEAAEKIKKYDELTKKVQDLEAELNEYLNIAKDIENPFANEDLLKLNTFIKENPNVDLHTALMLLKTDVNNLNAIDKIKLGIKIENPDFTEQHIDRYLKKKFDVEDISELYDDDNKELKLDIDIEAKKYEKIIKKHLPNLDVKYESKFVPEKIKEKIKQINEAQANLEQEIERVWLPVALEVENNVKEIPLPKYDSKESKVIDNYVKFVLSEEERKLMANEFVEYAKLFGLKDRNSEIEQVIATEVRKNFLLRNLAKIIQTASDKGASDEFARIKAMRDGIPVSGNVNKPPDNGGQNSGLDVLFNSELPNWRNMK